LETDVIHIVTSITIVYIQTKFNKKNLVKIETALRPNTSHQKRAYTPS